MRREWDVDYVDPRSLEFGTNAESMRVWVAELREMLDRVAGGGGGEASRARHTSRGKTERHLTEQGTSQLGCNTAPSQKCLAAKSPSRIVPETANTTAILIRFCVAIDIVDDA